MRERSYASEPGSRIALKLDAEKEINELDELDDRDAIDVDDDDTIECDIGIRTSTFSEPLDFGRRSQTLLETQSPPPCPIHVLDPVVSVQLQQNWQNSLIGAPKNQSVSLIISPVKCAANNNYNNQLAHTLNLLLYILLIVYKYLITQFYFVLRIDVEQI